MMKLAEIDLITYLGFKCNTEEGSSSLVRIKYFKLMLKTRKKNQQREESFRASVENIK